MVLVAVLAVVLACGLIALWIFDSHKRAREARRRRMATFRVVEPISQAEQVERLTRIRAHSERQTTSVRNARASAPIRNKEGNGFAADVDYSPLADMITSLHSKPTTTSSWFS